MTTRFIAVIVLKCTEISNHYVVDQELTQRCSSIILQKQTNKLIGKEITFVVSREGEGRGGAKREECKDWKLPFQRVEEEKLTGKCG